jgi:hypothetical protein
VILDVLSSQLELHKQWLAAWCHLCRVLVMGCHGEIPPHQN